MQLVTNGARVLLLSLALTGAQAQLSTCSYLVDGCCGLGCQNVICQALYSSGKLLGAAEQGIWINRTGWHTLYAHNGPADVACQQYLSGTAAATATRPQYCSWHGIICNSTAYSSTCSQPRWAYGVSNITITNNNLSGFISSEFAASMKKLHDCGLQILVIGGASFDLHGTISPLFGQLTQLKTLAIFGTNVTGSIPPELGNMTELENLDLNTNYLIGTIPPELGQLSTLQRLNLGYNGWSDRGEALTGTFPAEWLRLSSLQILMLDHNGLYGTLPDSLCRKLTKLSAVSFGNNGLSGPAIQFGNCFSLTALDLSDNHFTGPVPLPDGTAWAQLQNLRLNNNNFTGPLPSFDIGQAPQLSYMLLSNNSLTGTIPVSWTYLPFLTVVEASFNSISGEVPWQLAFQSRLWVLALDNNPNLTGVIDTRWRFSVGLSSLRLHNTDITGPLPGISRRQLASMADKQNLCGSDASGLGRLPLLQDVSIYNTNMTAKCILDPDGTCQDVEDALPWYLNLDYSAWQIPLPENGFASNDNMQCPTVIQEKYCHQAGPPTLYSNDIRPHWDVSPSYYHYLGCQCQAGFIEQRVQVWHADVLIPELRCEKALTPAQIAGISVSVSAVGLILLAYLAYVSWYGRFGLPRLRRAYADVRKRLVGAPSSGKISVVVTDIESYSALIVAMPLVMGKALSQHNNAVRKAAWTHFGFIVGQEGDSYILAFSDALDAVAFCLQSQQALKRIDWPTELLQYLQHQETALLGLNTPAHLTSTASACSPHGPGRLTTSEARWKNIAAVVGMGAGTGGGLAGADLPPSSVDGDHAVAAGPSREGSRFWPAISRPQRSSHSGSAAGSRACSSPVFSSDVPSSQPQHPCSPSALHGADASATASQAALTSLEEQHLHQQPRVATATALIPGLRVRMGIASGVLSEQEHDVLTCRMLEVARVVSDAALGGQVLMDGNTFKQVKDRLEELGQVGPSGYSRSNRVAGWGTPRGWLAKLVARHSKSLPAEAQVLDMGMYTIPGFKHSTARDAAAVLPQLPQLTSEAIAQLQAVSAIEKDPALVDTGQPSAKIKGGLTAVVPSPFAHDRVPANSLQQLHRATLTSAAATAAAAPPSVTLQPVPSAASVASPCACIRLHQVLAPRLVDRAHLFGNTLSLKEGSRCHDLPYFSAPAAASRPTLDADLQQQPLLVSEVRRMSNNGSCVTGDVAHTHTGRRATSLLVSQPSMNSQSKWSGGDGDGDGGAAAAPGAPARPVTRDDAVTFVFCSVVMPRVKLSMDTNPKLTAQVSSIVGKVVRECIMAFARTPAGSRSSPGQQAEGYLCRDLGGDMKYMLAFQNPRVALEWCLLVQEVLLWQAWPASLLDRPGKSKDASDHQLQVLGRRASMVIPTTAAAAAAAAHVGQPFWGVGNGVTHASPPVCAQSHRFGSQPLFRGPRLKMGVCCGSPQTVTPDHQGRADYHGNAVNMAARFEAICAQGGQVVCEASLAEAVVAEWTAIQQEAAAAATVLGQDADSTAEAPVPPSGAITSAQQSVQHAGVQPASYWSEQPLGRALPCSVSPFQAASRSAVQQQALAPVQLSPAAAASSINSLAAVASPHGSLSSSLADAAAASSSLAAAAAASIPTAGGALSKLVEDSDGAAIGDAMVWKAKAPLPGRTASPSLPDVITGTAGSPSAAANSVGTAPADSASVLTPRPAAGHAANGKATATGYAAGSGELDAGLGLSAAAAGASGGLLAGFFTAAATGLQAKGGVAAPRRSGRAPRASARSGALLLAPAPTDLACPSGVPELLPEAFAVEVHQVGKFLVKGHPGPVEIVEVLLSHLSARRQLLGDTILKVQKGHCIQLQTDRVASVHEVQLPGVARVYKQQHAQQLTAAAAAKADLAAPCAAQQVPSDGLSFTALQRQSPQQQSLVQRTSSLFASIRLGSRRLSSVGDVSAHSQSVAGSCDSTQTASAVHSSAKASGQRSPLSLLQQTEGMSEGGDAAAEHGAAAGLPVSWLPADTSVAPGAVADGTLGPPVMYGKQQTGVEPGDDAV